MKSIREVRVGAGTPRRCCAVRGRRPRRGQQAQDPKSAVPGGTTLLGVAGAGSRAPLAFGDGLLRCVPALMLVLGPIAYTIPAAAQGHDPSDPEPRTGLLRSEESAFLGFTLFAPLRSTSTYLVDMGGEVVHEWPSRFPPRNSVHLLSDGTLLRCERAPGKAVFHGGGQGGRLLQLAWDGGVLWDFVYSSEQHLQHHDAVPLPNGDVLLIAWERKTVEEALAAGRDPALLRSGEFWPDHVVQVRPERPAGGRIVWEWHVWDHLIQDRDPQRANFGDVAKHPELVDINADRNRRRLLEGEAREEHRRLAALGYTDAGESDRARDMEVSDWLHTNSIDYDAELDQIVLSVRNLGEVWVIDHGTTTEEAAGHSGGRRGRGGDLLYRWGNPAAYRAGGERDQKLFAQHDASWVRESGGARRLLVFNNGQGRPGGEYSAVDEILLPLDGERRYAREEGKAFGPVEPVWSYAGSPAARFYSSHLSGAQRLPNGNTLVCSGEQGRIFEVDAKGAIVWEYVNPFHANPFYDEKIAPHGGVRRGPEGLPEGAGPRSGDRGARGRRHGPPMDPGGLFRATRLAPDHPGLARLQE